APRAATALASGRNVRLAVESEDLLHLVLEHQLVQLDLLLLDLVVLRQEGLLIQGLESALVLLVLLEQTPEIEVGRYKLRLEVVVLRHRVCLRGGTSDGLLPGCRNGE